MYHFIRLAIVLATVAGLMLLPAALSSFVVVVALLSLTNVVGDRVRLAFLVNVFLAIFTTTFASLLSKTLHEAIAAERGLVFVSPALQWACTAWTEVFSLSERTMQSPMCRLVLNPSGNEAGIGLSIQCFLTLSLVVLWMPFRMTYSQGIELIKERNPEIFSISVLSVFLSGAIYSADRIASVFHGWPAAIEQRPLVFLFIFLTVWIATSLQASIREYARKLNAR